MTPQWIVPVIAFFYPGIEQPGTTLPAPTPDQIQLVQKLGSEKFQDREDAQEKLEKMDTEAYRALFDGATKDPDPEIRSRCSQILPKVTRYNIPKDPKTIPTLFGAYSLKVEFKSKRTFSINKEIFLRYYWRAIVRSDDSWKNDPSRFNLNYMTYLLPKATHYMFLDMRLMGYSRADIDELIIAMNKNIKKMSDNRSYDYYEWVRNY